LEGKKKKDRIQRRHHIGGGEIFPGEGKERGGKPRGEKENPSIGRRERIILKTKKKRRKKGKTL